jgi:hypothetical protein
MNIEDIENMTNDEMKELLIKYINKENKIKEYRKKKNNEYYKRKTNKN